MHRIRLNYLDYNTACDLHALSEDLGNINRINLIDIRILSESRMMIKKRPSYQLKFIVFVISPKKTIYPN